MIAPINPPRMTFGVTMLTSIRPFAIAFATAVPTVKAARKLNPAAQMTAARGTQHTRSDDRCDGIRRIVEAVDEIEDESHEYNRGYVIKHGAKRS
jgi:methionine aminopeptidase